MGSSSKLDGATMRRVHDAILDAYPSRGSLARMVRFELGENLDALVTSGDLDDAVADLVRWAQARGRLDALLAAARDGNDTNLELRALVEELAPAGTPGGSGGPALLTREQKRELVDRLLSTPPASTFAGRTALLGEAASLGLDRSEANARLDLEGIVQQLDGLRAREALAALIEGAIDYVRGTAVARDLEALHDAVKRSG